MNNKLEVIGIDHGWSMMKTISQVFVTGVRNCMAANGFYWCNYYCMFCSTARVGL